MALPVAHAAGGYLAYEAMRPSGPHRPGMLTLANAPDLDLLPGLAIGSPQVFHRGVTYTLVAAVVVGLVAWLGARRRGAAPGMVGLLAGLAALAWASHIITAVAAVHAVRLGRTLLRVRTADVA
jgi:hypothetical protein